MRSGRRDGVAVDRDGDRKWVGEEPVSAALREEGVELPRREGQTDVEALRHIRAELDDFVQRRRRELGD